MSKDNSIKLGSTNITIKEHKGKQWLIHGCKAVARWTTDKESNVMLGFTKFDGYDEKVHDKVINIYKKYILTNQKRKERLEKKK